MRPNGVSRYDRYQEMLSFRQLGLSEAAQTNLIKAMLEWCDQPNSRSFEQFLDERCIHEATMYDWIDKYPDIAETVRYVKTHIGIIREAGIADRKYDPRAYEMTQRYYSMPWRAAVDEDYARRKELANAQPEHTTLVVFDTLAEDLKQERQSIVVKDSVAVKSIQAPAEDRSTEGEFGASGHDQD